MPIQTTVHLTEYTTISFIWFNYKSNKLGIKTHRGKALSSASIHSILKRKQQRDDASFAIHCYKTFSNCGVVYNSKLNSKHFNGETNVDI